MEVKPEEPAVIVPVVTEPTPEVQAPVVAPVEVAPVASEPTPALEAVEAKTPTPKAKKKGKK